MRAEIQMRSGHSVWAKTRQAYDIINIQGLLNQYWDSTEHEFMVPSQSRPPTSPPFLIEKHSGHVPWKVRWAFRVTILYTRPSLCNSPSQPATNAPQADSLRALLHKLEDLLKEYSPLMTGTTERVMDKSIKYGAVFAEVCSPIQGASQTLTYFSLIRSQRRSLILPASLLRFVLTTTSVAEVGITLDVQLLKEQNRYDQIPLSLFDWLQRVVPLAKTVADEIICKETNILEEIIPRMFKVMQRVAEYSCNYVRRGRLGA